MRRGTRHRAWGRRGRLGTLAACLLPLALQACLPSSQKENSRALAAADSAAQAIAEAVPVDTLAQVWTARAPEADPMTVPSTIAWVGEALAVVETQEGSVRRFSAEGDYRDRTDVPTGSFPYGAGVRGDTLVVLARGTPALLWVVPGEGVVDAANEMAVFESDGLTAYRMIAAGAPSHLLPGGRLMVEIGPSQGAAVADLFRSAGLQEVTVITDLDGDGAERALQSLRAEIRMRERALTAIGARDVADPRVRLPRLVIVVDEFAALLGEHPELHTVFTDVAARGRALGMHLVLGTQRIAGVVRDALLANCPLRVSLRVADRGDSRAVVGTEDAALLPGGRDGAGVAIVRRASDAEPQRVRIGLSDEGLLDRVCARGAETGPAPRPIWHPTLPERIDISDPRLSAGEAGRLASDLTLGLADLPAEQDQRRVGVLVADRSLLVVGRAGSGRSCAAALIAAQAPGGSVWIPADLEHGWDQLVGCAERPPAAGTAIVLDDVDTLLARLPADHAAAAISLLCLFCPLSRAGGDVYLSCFDRPLRGSGP